MECINCNKKLFGGENIQVWHICSFGHFICDSCSRQQVCPDCNTPTKRATLTMDEDSETSRTVYSANVLFRPIGSMPRYREAGDIGPPTLHFGYNEAYCPFIVLQPEINVTEAESQWSFASGAFEEAQLEDTYQKEHLMKYFQIIPSQENSQITEANNDEPREPEVPSTSSHQEKWFLDSYFKTLKTSDTVKELPSVLSLNLSSPNKSDAKSFMLSGSNKMSPSSSITSSSPDTLCGSRLHKILHLTKKNVSFKQKLL